MMNENISCNYFEVDEKRNTLDNFVTSCSLFTIILNSFVLYLAFVYINLNKNLEQLFVINMTVANLIFGLVYMSTVKLNMDIPWFLCRPYYITVWTCSFASVMFLLLLNVHKLVILFFPIHSFICISKKKILMQIFFCWSGVLMSAVWFSLEPTLEHLEMKCHQCTIRLDPKWYLFMITFFYIFPLLMSLILSVMIFGFAQKRSRRTRKRSLRSRNETKNIFKRIFFVFTSTIWTALTFLPYRVTYSKIEFCRILEDDPSYCSDDSLILVQYCFLFLLTFSTAVNPLITIFTQKPYRKGALETWTKVFICIKTEKCNITYKFTRKPIILEMDTTNVHI